jgi:beta-glucosidase
VREAFLRVWARDGGREYATVDISERTLREVHLPPFIAAVAAVWRAIMPAFTDLAGIPMTANTALLRHYLRDQLGFDGRADQRLQRDRRADSPRHRR